jgi:hypothetical protein
MPNVLYLGDIDADFKFAERAQTPQADFSDSENGETFNETIMDGEKLDRILEETLAEVINEKVVFEKTSEKRMNNLTGPLDDTEDIASRIGPANLENVSEGTGEEKAAPVVLTRTYHLEAEEENGDNDALNGLSEHVRAAFRELEDRAEKEISRCII